ncbi:MAG: Gfo/Idh/MocA family oxidoreductase [Anaerolineae bacterium]|jgi:predicted dehydrogenase|nr:Gfo/Idh/MocA family oxidoreductase [Anaerolineae bacterium]
MSTEKKLRAVLVGCGGISNAWLDASQRIPAVEIVGLVDLNKEAAIGQQAKYGLDDAIVATQMEAVIEQTNPDVVFDCTLPGAHHKVATLAMRMGCDVFGEKPLADSLAHAQAIIETMRDTGRIHATMQNRRFSPGSRIMQQFLADKSIGELTTLNADFYLGAHFGGFRDHMQHVLILDMAIHTFDLARMLIDADPVGVYCHEWNPEGSWYDQDASAVAIFEFDNGVVYTYRGSWCAEGMNTTWESDWRAIGTKGSILWDGHTSFKAAVKSENAPQGFISTMNPLDAPLIDPNIPLSGHYGAIQHFVDSILAGKTPETISTDNYKSLAMVFGAIESAESGRHVTINPDC